MSKPQDTTGEVQLRNMAGHLRGLVAELRAGILADFDEAADRLDSIAEAADAYANYLGRDHPTPDADPVLARERRVIEAIGDFARNKGASNGGQVRTDR